MCICICILCLYAHVYHISLCTILDCDQQMRRYLAVPGLLWVQLQGWMMGQPQLPNCCIVYVTCIINCLHIVSIGYYVGLCMSMALVGCGLESRHKLGKGKCWLE